MWEGNCDALGRLERIDGALGLGRFAAEFVGHASYAVPNDSTPATSPLSIFSPNIPPLWFALPVFLRFLPIHPLPFFSICAFGPHGATAFGSP